MPEFPEINREMESEMNEISENALADMTDEELALLAKDGNRGARNILYIRLQSLIASRIYSAKRLLGRLTAGSGPLEPADIDQEAFLMFCEILDDWIPARMPFVAYLQKLITWRAYRYVRSTLHFRSTTVRQAPAAEHWRVDGEVREGVPTGDPAILVEGTEEWNTLLAQVKDDWQRFVRLKFWVGLSSPQIARISHRSTRTVNRSLRAALSQLRDHVEEEREA